MYTDEAKPTARRGIWRIGNSIGVRERIADFPTVCVECGKDNDCQKLKCNLRTNRKLWMFFFPMLAPFTASINIEPQLCKIHRDKEITSRMVGHGMLLFGFLSLLTVPVVTAAFPKADMDALAASIPIGFLTLQIWLYYRIFRRRCITALLIRGRDAVIEDIPYPLLQALPIVED